MASFIKPLAIATGVYTGLQLGTKLQEASFKKAGSLAISFARDLSVAILARMAFDSTIKAYNNIASIGLFFVTYGSLKFFDRSRVSEKHVHGITETANSIAALVIFLKIALPEYQEFLPVIIYEI